MVTRWSPSLLPGIITQIGRHEGKAPVKKTFFNLEAAKQDRFLAVCAEEFAQSGFEAASTNRIVERLGIAKGSFFKYAESKEDVYLYLVRLTLEDLGRIQAARETYHSPDLLRRVQELLRAHMAYAASEPVRYCLVLRAFLDTRSPLCPRLLELRDSVSAASGSGIYDGVDWGMYGFQRDEVLELLGLLDLGLRHSALQALSADADPASLEAYINHVLDLAIRVLSSGIYRA